MTPQKIINNLIQIKNHLLKPKIMTFLKKNYYTFCFLFISTILVAQQPPKKVDAILQNINTATLTTKILYDRVFSIAHLDTFNDSTNVSNTKYFEQAVNELYNASEHQKFMPYKTLRTFYTSKANYNTLDIGIVNANFQQLNYVATNENLGALKVVNEEVEKINNQ